MNKRFLNEYNKYNKYINSQEEDITYVQPIILHATNILELYDINHIEDLIILIKNNNITSFNLFNRLLSCWIIKYFKLLKTNNKYLTNIFIEYYKHNTQLHEYITETEIDTFVEKWLNKKIKNSFDFNCHNDFINYINIKFNINI